MLKELEKAEDAVVVSEQGEKRVLISNRRKWSIISKAIVPLLDAIPDELCVLHSGLAIIFLRTAFENIRISMLTIRLQLAQSRERVRRDILNTFKDILGIITIACSKS